MSENDAYNSVNSMVNFARQQKGAELQLKLLGSDEDIDVGSFEVTADFLLVKTLSSKLLYVRYEAVAAIIVVPEWNDEDE